MNNTNAILTFTCSFHIKRTKSGYDHRDIRDKLGRSLYNRKNYNHNDDFDNNYKANLYTVHSSIGVAPR